MSYPKKYKMPFAARGEFSVIQDEPEEQGAGIANFAEGFPPELSKPFNETGKPVRRLDMNGILNAITEFQIYQQNGGMFKWDNQTDYEPPCIIYDEGAKNFYKCVDKTGPSFGNVTKPSEDKAEAVWQEIAGGSVIESLQSEINGKAPKVHSHPTTQITGLSKYVDDKCTVGAQTFTRSAKSATYAKVEFTVSASRDAYGRLTGLSFTNSNCVDTDTDVDVDVDYDSDTDSDAY